MSTSTPIKSRNVFGAANNYPITFDATDFSVATYSAKLEGPFALTIRIDNASSVFNATLEPSPLYIGIQVNTETGSYSVGDRQHIAFCPKFSQVTISGSSVPQLARIDGVITSIVLNLYTLGSQETAQVVKAQLSFDPAYVPIGAPPIIGRDSQVYEAGIYNYLYSATSITAVTIGQIMIDTLAIPRDLRFRLKMLSMQVAPTAAPRQASVSLVITDRLGNAHISYDLSSDTVLWNVLNIQLNTVLNGNYRVQVVGSNTTGAAVGCVTSLISEVMY